MSTNDERPCLSCGTTWAVDDVLSYEPPTWTIGETIAERVCFLCRSGDRAVRSIIQGDFAVGPMVPFDWSGFFLGNIFIYACPKCPPLTFPNIPLLEPKRD